MPKFRPFKPLPMRARIVPLLAIAGFALAVGGCGAAVNIPTVPKFDFGSPHGDSAAFDIDGTTFSVTQSGHISASFSDVPKLNHSGPLGCKGRYFTAHYTEHIEVYFRYAAKDAYLLIDNGTDPVFHFPDRPRRADESLVWKRSFGGRPISVRVTCQKPGA